MITENGSMYSQADKTISINKDHGSNPFIFAHELGHAIDNILFNDLSASKEIQQTFGKDLQSYKNQTSVECNKVLATLRIFIQGFWMVNLTICRSGCGNICNINRIPKYCF